MAYSFGGGIRPELGRTDYTPFLQGALSGAQMSARGSESIGQGLQNLGASAGKAIEKRKENKELNRMLDGQVKQAKSVAESLSSIEGMPAGVGKLLSDYVDLADNPEISTKEKAAAAQVFLNQVPQVVKLGIDAGEKIRNRSLDSGIQNAVNLNTDTEGNIDMRGVMATLSELGINLTEAAPKIQAISKMSPQQFQASVQTLENPTTGKPITAVATSRGGVQVLPEERDPEDTLTARQKNIEFETEQFKKIPELLKDGKDKDALALAQALRLRDEFGRPITLQALRMLYADGQGGSEQMEQVQEVPLPPGWKQQ